VAVVAKQELLRFAEGVEAMYTKLGCSLLLFERAIRTKSGRDHMQVQCIPIADSKLSQALDLFGKNAALPQLHFHELTVSMS
jgi:hypothetical protein